MSLRRVRPQGREHPLPRLGSIAVRRQVVDQLRRSLHQLRAREVPHGRRGCRYGKVLEIGAGTGFFITTCRRLASSGSRSRPTSPRAWSRSVAERESPGSTHGCAHADAEALPFEDATSIWSSVMRSSITCRMSMRRSRSVPRPEARRALRGVRRADPARLQGRRPRQARAGEVVKVLGDDSTSSSRRRRTRMMSRRSKARRPPRVPPAHVRVRATAGFADRSSEPRSSSAVFGWSTRTIEAMARPVCSPRNGSGSHTGTT